MKIQEFTEKEVMWDMTRVTYKVTLKLSHFSRIKDVKGCYKAVKPKLYRRHVKVR